MKDSIHKKLAEHIRKTVGRHELPYEPGSWEEFQRLRRKRRQRQPLIWFRYAMAACLLLGVLGVPVWLYRNPPEVSMEHRAERKKQADKRVENRPPVEPTLADRVISRQATEKPLRPKTNENNQANYEWKNRVPDQNESYLTTAENQKPAVSPNRQFNQEEKSGSGISQVPGTSPGDDRPTPYSAVNKELAVSLLPDRFVSFERIPLRSSKPYRWSQRPLGLPLHVRPEEQMTAQLSPAKPAGKPILGVSLAPQSVRNTSTAPALAMGGGLYSEIPLNRRFSLSTGLSVAQQKLGNRSELVPMSTTPVLVGTDIRLMAVDLPVNIRFRPLRSLKTGFYAEAGLSSVAFLNERRAEIYQQMKPVTVLVTGSNGQPQPVTQYVMAQETINHTVPAFQKIYWGRIFNLSVGVERRINDRFRLSAEPYLKYPVGPFTRENLLLGSGGVNLRLGFQSGR